MKKIVTFISLPLLFSRPSTSAEAHLIKCAKAGEREAFSQLYDQHVASIYKFIASRIREEMVAEDLTSQVFLKAWENIGRYRNLGLPFRAWLFRIARNTLIDHYRTANSHDCLDRLPVNEPAPEGNIEEQIEGYIEKKELVEAIDQLTNEQRQAICLKFLQGFSNREVARRMGKGTGAIRALQMRGLQTLAKNLRNG